MIPIVIKKSSELRIMSQLVNPGSLGSFGTWLWIWLVCECRHV